MDRSASQHPPNDFFFSLTMKTSSHKAQYMRRNDYFIINQSSYFSVSVWPSPFSSPATISLLFKREERTTPRRNGWGDHITPQKCRGLRRRGEAERAAERGAETGEHMKECITEGGRGRLIEGDGWREEKVREREGGRGNTFIFFKHC